MRGFQKVLTSLTILAVLLATKSVNAQVKFQTPIYKSTLAPAQFMASGDGVTTAESLMKWVQVGYSNKDSLRPDTPSQWQSGENLIAIVPTGWQIGFQNRQENLQTVEFVPKGQTIVNWKSLLTIQIFFGDLAQSPRQVVDASTALARKFCPRLDVSSVLMAKENGYPVALWLQNCPNNSQVNQSEITLFKVMQGRESLYFVHRAWRFPIRSAGQTLPIQPQEFQEWGKYMRLVGVCDTRVPERSCP
jgi:hypothetical protein